MSRISGHDVPWLLDPTLLLQANDYAAIAKPSGRSGYILLYTCMNANVNMIREARRLAACIGKTLVEVGNYGINRYVFGHEVIDDAGVEEWLGLFMNADAVVCNSFHGICFSVIFQKPFYVFSRGNEDTRFQNICEATGLSDRLLPKDGAIPREDAPIDFDDVAHRLVPLRERSMRFIDENIVMPTKEGS